MGASKFGYPNINTGKYSNEQNIQNTKSFLYSMSEEVSQHFEMMETEIENLKAEIERLRNG